MANLIGQWHTSMPVAIRANPFLTTFDLLATLSLLGLLAHFYTGGDLSALSLPGYAAVLARVGLHALSDTFPLIQAGPGSTTMRKGRAVVPPLARGLLLATPLLFIFTVLLGSADLIFATTLERILAQLMSSLREIIFRSAVIFAVAWIVAGGLASALLGDGASGTPLLDRAGTRLRLYEQAFGYTRLRLTVHVFMVWLGLLLLWLPLGEWWDRGRIVSPMAGERRAGRFAIGAFVAALGFLVSLNALNPDAFIVRQNLARRQKTGRLDALYPASLSDDAVPQLTSAVATLRGTQREVLCGRLQERLAALKEDPRPLRWPAWHLSTRRAYRALNDDGWQDACPPPAEEEQ